jgi:TfuA protein
MKMIAFVGPSLPKVNTQRTRQCHFAPPIRRGNLDDVDEYDVVVIIDGEFGQNLSVSPKEILKILEAKKTVVGAASMGALRASELDLYGMIGIGWIYDRFVRAAVRCDDDVALTYSPQDFTPLTVPMVNIEYWMTLTAIRATVSAQERQQILKMARSVFFAERTEAMVNQIFERTLGRNRLACLLQEFNGVFPDIKQLDATRAITAAAKICNIDCGSFSQGR